MKNIKQLVEHHLKQNRERIVKMLRKHYKMDEKSAKKAEKNINTATRTFMRETFTFSSVICGTQTLSINKPFWAVQESNSIKRMYELLNVDYPDFVNWAVMALTVPFYQSLGDTLGYYNGNWEFNYGDTNRAPEYVNELLYEFIYLGGVNNISITNWLASDDSILYMATMEVVSEDIRNPGNFGEKIKKAYLEKKGILVNRNPGDTTMEALGIQENIEWDKLSYNSKSIGNGAAMRSGCIGIFYPGFQNRKKLIECAVESSRITHNSTIAILGSVVSALFTAFALERMHINRWPHELLELLRSNLIDDYMEKSRPNEYKLYYQDKGLYYGQWEKYVSRTFSGINVRTDLKFMKNPVERYRYLSENFSKGCDIPGSCGDDVVIMAYDALLRCDGVFEKLLVYSVLHPGDSDTVGSIAFSWFGALYHSPMEDLILHDKFIDLEFYEKLFSLLENNMELAVEIYATDIYNNVASQYIAQYVG